MGGEQIDEEGDGRWREGSERGGEQRDEEGDGRGARGERWEVSRDIRREMWEMGPPQIYTEG